MHRKRTSIGFLVVALFAALASPALAGGWATVRLDEPPGDVVANQPWQIGFMVLQHDVTPTSDVTPVVRAVHQETGESVSFTTAQEGPEGHFVAELTLPLSGDWKWLIQPEPYGETSFETLTVLARPRGDYTASVLDGTCAAPGEIAFPLADAQPLGNATSASLPVAFSSSTIDTPLRELVDRGHAIGIGEYGAAPMACGNISDASRTESGELVVALQDAAHTANVGVAVLHDEGDAAAVSLYLLNPDTGTAMRNDTVTVADPSLTIDILDAMVFDPFTLDARVGDTVTWLNQSPIAHTVTGEDLAFDDSGLIEPGESFSITFDTPGTYHYRCGPHPSMVGEIVVS